MLPVRVFTSPVTKADSAWPAWSRDLDQFFDRVLEPKLTTSFRVDVREEKGDLIFEAEIPGLTKDDLEITVEDGVLSIAAEYKCSTDEEKSDYHLRERRYGKVSRSFQLPSTANAEKISALVKDGILTLKVPMKEEARPRKIQVQ